MTLARKYAICCSDCYDLGPWRGTPTEAREAADVLGWSFVLKQSTLLINRRRQRVDYCPACKGWGGRG